jgi:hypothetical protein
MRSQWATRLMPREVSRFRRFRFASALLRVRSRNFLAADNNVTDLDCMTREHQTSTHAEATSPPVFV